MTTSATDSLVLFPIGNKRFALRSELVAELARPDRLQTFPHTTPMISGVLVRRGQVVPVFELASVLVGPGTPAGKFYLIATRRFADAVELAAIPVTGECELVSARVSAPGKHCPEYVSGSISIGDEMIEVIELERLFAGHSEHKAMAPAEVSA